jgi:hypothetical protein
VAPNVLLKDASFLLEHILPARMVQDDAYSTLLEADHVSFLDPEYRFSAHPSYGQPADQRRDFTVAGTAGVLRYPGLIEAETLCN